MTTQTRLEKLKDFVRYYANCPCCQSDDECVYDCSFADDDPNAYEVMQMARDALKDDGE